MNAETVKAAVKQCERVGLDVTVANVAANIQMKPGDYNAMIIAGVKSRVAPLLRKLGYITVAVVDEASGDIRVIKVEMKDASLSELRAQLRIKHRNLARVKVQYDALKMLVEFLEAKERELGYEPYVYQFQEDARRIYSMHGLELPDDWGEAL